MGFFSKLFKRDKKEEEKSNVTVAGVEISEILEENKGIKDEIKDKELDEKIVDETIEKEEIKEIVNENKEEKVEIAIKEEIKEEPKKEENKGFFASLKDKLFKSREGLFGKLKSFILGRDVIDYEMYEELEDCLLYTSPSPRD